MLRFDRFLQAHPELASEPLETMLEHWAAAKPTRHHAAECEKLGRILTKARYRHRSEHPAETLQTRGRSRRWRGSIDGRTSTARPTSGGCSISPAPIRRRVHRCGPLSLYTMLLLAYCAGLRRSELARLDLGDVDLQSGTITIRETKFFKTRILPLPDSVMAELRAYLDAQAARRRTAGPAVGAVLAGPGQWSLRPGGDRMADRRRHAPRRVQAALPGETGPRVHDLRHSMVVNRILEWYRSGINPQDRLPFLATYLGHRDINSTLVYITVTQDLLQEANERFRAVGAPLPQLRQEVRP